MYKTSTVALAKRIIRSFGNRNRCHTEIVKKILYLFQMSAEKIVAALDPVAFDKLGIKIKESLTGLKFPGNM
jgi:hypothetical protein